MEFINKYFQQVKQITDLIDRNKIKKMIEVLSHLKDKQGRLFVLGVGGSAANASHAVNDFRKIAGIEAYAPTDNVSELTARTNDEGWHSFFVEWLKVSRLKSDDVLLILSVGGGNIEKNISSNLVIALKYAKNIGSKILGIVGRDGGYTAEVADAALIIPTVDKKNITPHAEAFQAILWHLIVSHPTLASSSTKWESVDSSLQKDPRFLS